MIHLNKSNIRNDGRGAARRQGVQIPKKGAVHVTALSKETYPEFLLVLTRVMTHCQTLQSTRIPEAFAKCLEGSSQGRITNVSYDEVNVQATVCVLDGDRVTVFGTPEEFRKAIRKVGVDELNDIIRQQKKVSPYARAAYA